MGVRKILKNPIPITYENQETLADEWYVWLNDGKKDIHLRIESFPYVRFFVFFFRR